MGEIRDDAKSTKNVTAGKFYQNGAKASFVHDKNKGRYVQIKNGV